MNIFFDENNEYTFVCTKCNKMLSFKYLSEDSETCTNCLGIKAEHAENKKLEQTDEIQDDLKLPKIFPKKDFYLKPIEKGSKRMPFIDLGESLISIENIVSVEKRNAKIAGADDTVTIDKDAKMFYIEITTQDNKNYKSSAYTEKECNVKLIAIKKQIKKAYKIYKL